MPAHPSLSTLADAAVASGGTCHYYPGWHNFPVYPCDTLKFPFIFVKRALHGLYFMEPFPNLSCELREKS